MTNREHGIVLVGLIRHIVEVIHHYEGSDSGKYYIHFRCDEEDDLRFLVDISEASNNPMMIQADDKGWYYTLIIHHNYDILEHYLNGGGQWEAGT
jgi:hypothetical protein